nr:hypothetical protein [Nitrosomonas nitrosa]
MTFTMTDLDHHGGATAKRPIAVVTACILPKLVNQVGGDAEESPPFRRAPAIVFRHHAASG